MMQEKLEKLKAEAEKSIGKKLVFSDGTPENRVMIIGEAPGRNEEEQGKPFVGAAGKTLNKALELAGMKRSEVYITNIVMWRPPDNRKPTKDEVEICKPFLLRQIEIIKPKIICTLGNTSLEFFAKGKPITQFHGKEIEIEIDGFKFTILPTFHPAAILYNRTLQKEFESDIKTLASYLK